LGRITEDHTEEEIRCFVGYFDEKDEILTKHISFVVNNPDIAYFELSDYVDSVLKHNGVKASPQTGFDLMRALIDRYKANSNIKDG
jgi:hypothetical protein